MINCCGTGGGLARSVWTQVGDTLYGASGSPTDFIFYWKFAYASGAITDGRGGVGHSGGTGNPAGIYYDGTNDLLHVAYRYDSCCGLDGSIHAVNPATLADVYSTPLAYMPPPAAIDSATALAGDGSNTFYYGGASGTQFTLTQLVAGPSGYTQTVESGAPALAAPASAGSLVWDGSTVLYIVNESDARLRLYTRLGTNSYRLDDLLTTTLGAGAHPAVLRRGGSGDLMVFYRDNTAQPTGEINYLSRTAGIWNAPLTLAGGAATGWSAVSASADDRNSPGIARVAYVTGTASPFTLTEDSVALVVTNPLTAPDQASASSFAFGDPVASGGAVSPDPVNLATGSLVVQASDLSLPGRVLGFAFTRWYNSADPTLGPLGAGWTHSYNWSLVDSGATVDIRRGDGSHATFTRNTDGSYADPPNVFDVLTKNVDGTYRLTLPSQLGYDFDSAGRLTRMSEPAGNQITLSYSGGSLAAVTDAVGRQISFGYDTQGHLTSVLDPIGRRTRYGYDSVGRLTSVTDAVGGIWRYGYDGATRHITTITDPDGRLRVTNTYDAQGRVVQQRDALGALTTIAYAPAQTTLTDPRGNASTYTFDSRMRVLSQTTTVGAATYTITYAYDARGNRTAVTDRNGQRTDFSYDARGNLLTKTDPSPDGVAPRPLTTFSYDARNNLTQVADALGFLTTLTYDPATNVLLSVSRQIDAASTAVTKYEYADPANPGLPTRVIAPRGNTGPAPDLAYATTLAYDAQGNLASRTDPDGARTTFAYDAVGRLVRFVDPDGNAAGADPAAHTWTIAYDPLDRETSRADPLGNTLSYTYDGAGNRTSLTDRSGNVTSYSYDANTRLAATQQRPDPIGQPALVYTTQVTRDANGNATRITQANGVTTDYAFDALDRLVSVTTHPTPTTALTTSYILDGNGQPTARTTGDGVSVSYAYDALARLVSVSGPGLAISYAYDGLGRRTQMRDATGTTTYQYDGLGRVTGTGAPAGTLGYRYDPDGNRTALVYPGGDTVSYAYSPGGRLTSLTDWAGRVSTYAYQPSGLVASVAYPNGMTAAYAYDRAQRLTQLSYSRGTVIASERYTLDPEGNRTALEDLFGATPAVSGSLRYDGLSRLTSFERHLSANGFPISNETFALDPASNITTRSGPAAAFSYDGANRMTSDGARAFVWDGADRLTQRGTDTFAYDPLSRLTSATVAGTTRSYTYDGDGLLRSRSEGTITTSFLYDTSIAPAPLLAADGERIVYGLGPLYRVHPSGTYDTLVRDGLGSVRLEVSAAGKITNAYDYLAYGATNAASATPLLGFAGELHDPSGLIYLRARWYDPVVGRFMSRDPVAGDAALPATTNSYGYAMGNPSFFTDPSGRCGFLISVCVGVVIGAVTGAAGAVAQGGSVQQIAVAAAVGAVSGGVAGVPGLGTRVLVGAGIGATFDLVGQLTVNPNLGAVNWGSVAGAALGGGLSSYGARQTLRFGETLQAARWTREWAAALIGVGPSAGLPAFGGALWTSARASGTFRTSLDLSAATPGAGDGTGPLSQPK